MAQIKRMPYKCPPQSITAMLEETKEIVQQNKGVSMMLAVKCEDGSVMTAYYDCDFGTRQEIAGHIQCDIVDQMILSNLGERY